MSKIVRTKEKATGGITPEEKAKLDLVSREWIDVSMRTDPIEPDKIIPAIEGIYSAAGLKKPRVVIVPSPLVMAFAYGASAWIWYCRKTGEATAATDAATRAATYAATDAATDAATRAATYVATTAATRDATRAATRAATDAATDAATYVATDAATDAATTAATTAATRAATYAATRAATRAATDAATTAATRAATYAATRAATRAATYAATTAATDAATTAATYDATDAATYAATRAATYDATTAATYAATDAATRAATTAATTAATYAATDAATDAATRAATTAATTAATDDIELNEKSACFLLAGQGGLNCASRWRYVYQGGNMWSGWISYIVGFRDVIGLDLPEHKKFKFYEEAARHGGFRVMHEEFCIVSDFPEIIKKDEQNRPHCENGPSHRWRDGWSLYHWHGVRVPDEWIEDRANLTAKIALTWENIEQRRAACEIVGWNKILSELNAKVIDKDGDPEIGTLLEVDLPDSGIERFLRVMCGTGREFAIPVPKDCGNTALEANAWTYGLDKYEYKPEVRT